MDNYIDIIFEELKTELEQLTERNSDIDYLTIAVHAPIDNTGIWVSGCFQTKRKGKRTVYCFKNFAELKEGLERSKKERSKNES